VRRIPFFLIFLAGILVVGLSASQSRQIFQDLLPPGQRFEAPFQKGEVLRYEVNWKPVFFFPAFKAGELRFLVDQAQYRGRDTYRISAWAESDGLLARVAGFEIRNYYQSDIDREDYRSYRNVQKTRQGDRKRDIEIIFDYEDGRTYFREVDVGADPPKELKRKTIRNMPQVVIDVVSVFYVGRLRELEPGQHFAFQLSNGDDFKEIRVETLGTERVSTPVGNFSAVKLTTRGGLFREHGEFRVWYSLDDLRVPVKFEADAKFGKVYGKLLEYRSPTLSRGVIRSN